MKSLEFANEYRNETIKSMNAYIDNCDKYKQEINKCYFNLLEEQFAHFEIIKQDLEVLEIIKKKKVDVDQLCFLLTQYYELDNLLNKYNAYIIEKDKQLTMEELLKLKQWLEENN